MDNKNQEYIYIPKTKKFYKVADVVASFTDVDRSFTKFKVSPDGHYVVLYAPYDGIHNWDLQFATKHLPEGITEYIIGHLT